MNSLMAEMVTINTNLYMAFDIGVGVDDLGHPNSALWEKTEGALYIGDSEGSWLYYQPDGPDFKGINLFAYRRDKHYWESVAIATLVGVPVNFYLNLGCGEMYSGDGVIHRTNELIAWRMCFPCV